MIELEAGPSDDREFVALAGRLFAGAAMEHGHRRVRVVHVENWFGDRWLGFCGKWLGMLGLRHRSMQDELNIPPFHPHRVISELDYQRIDSRFDGPKEASMRLHGERSSHQNLRRHIQEAGLYAWYSSRSAVLDKGAVMAYSVRAEGNSGWYAMFEKKGEGWKPIRCTGIGDDTIRRLIEQGKPAGV